jgi:ABC-type nitrate/sulfonate/bicarbonate transport system substrate-binding protein
MHAGRSFWIGACAAVLAAAGIAGAQEPVKLKLGDPAQSLNAIAAQTMIKQGFDKKHGIAVEYVTYPTLDGLFTAIRGKAVDIGFGGWTAFAQFRSKGAPITMIFPVGRGISLDVVVPANSPIKSLADLKGKKIGSYAGAAGTATALLRVITSKFFGYDPGKTNHLQYAGAALLPDLLAKGDLDAVLLFDPIAVRAIASGKFKSIGNLPTIYKEKVGEDFLWIGYATNDDVIAKHPEALKAFNKAWLEAVAYVKAHPEVFEPLAKALGLDAAGAKLLRERVLADYVTEWTAKDIATFKKFRALANEVMGAGFLDELPEAAFTTRFNPQ